MKQLSWPFRALVAVSGVVCVAMGAAAAHGLSRILGPEQLQWINTGVFYQLIHLVAALAVAQRNRLAALSWIIGGWLFAGSLYCLAFWGAKVFGPITPLGGLILMIGWLCLMLPSKSVSHDK